MKVFGKQVDIEEPGAKRPRCADPVHGHAAEDPAGVADSSGAGDVDGAGLGESIMMDPSIAHRDPTAAEPEPEPEDAGPTENRIASAEPAAGVDAAAGPDAAAGIDAAAAAGATEVPGANHGGRSSTSTSAWVSP